MKPEELRFRWTPELSSLGLRSLQGNGNEPYPNLADGSRDLRGLTISQFIKNVTVSDANLSHSATKGFGQFGMCHVLRCSFREAMLTTNIGNNFQDCDFSIAQLRGVVPRGRFETATSHQRICRQQWEIKFNSSVAPSSRRTFGKQLWLTACLRTANLQAASSEVAHWRRQDLTAARWRQLSLATH